MAGILEGVKLHSCGQAVPFGLTSVRSSARCPVGCCLLYRGTRRSRQRLSCQLSTPKPSR